MAKKRTTKKKGIPASAIAAGVLAAGAAAAAGYYFYGSKDAKQHRKDAARWMNSLRREVVRDAKKVGNLTEAVLEEVIDRAAAAYAGAKEVDPKELKEIVAELKSNWRRIKAEAEGATTRAKRTATKTKRIATKATRRATK